MFVLTRPDSASGDRVGVGSSHIIDADTIIVSNETICLASSDAAETEQHGQPPARDATLASSRQRQGSRGTSELPEAAVSQKPEGDWDAFLEHATALMTIATWHVVRNVYALMGLHTLPTERKKPRGNNHEKILAFSLAFSSHLRQYPNTFSTLIRYLPCNQSS